MKFKRINKTLLSGIILIASGLIVVRMLNDGSAGLIVTGIGGLLFLLGINEKQEKVN